MDIYNKISLPKKHKLTDLEVIELRKDFINGLSKKQLIEKYKVDRRTIERIIQNKSRIL